MLAVVQLGSESTFSICEGIMRCIFSLLAGALLAMLGFGAPPPGEVQPLRDRAIRSKEAPRYRNSITGFVFDENRNPIADVYVELYSNEGSPISRTKTSAVGTFSFHGLGDGVFTLKVLPYGKSFVSQEKRVSLVSFGARPGFGAVYEQVDFYLKARKASANPLGPPGVVFAQEVPSKAQALYERAIELLDDKKDDEGLAKLREAIEAFPKYFAALDRLGGEYVVRKYYRPAYILLTLATQVNSKSHSSWLGLGISQFRLNDPIASLASVQRAYELHPEAVNGLLWYGIALHANNRLAEALTALKKADRLSKGTVAEVNFQMARVLKDQGEYLEAAKQLELVLEKDPKAENAEDLKKTIELLKSKKA
jgi:hypothetical protein